MFKYLPIILLMSGCVPDRDKQLFSVGVLVYVLYLVMLLIIFLVPTLHHTKIFQFVISKSKTPARYLATLITITGIAIAIYGLLQYGQSMTFKLIPVLGGVVVVTGQCLRLWSKCSNKYKQSLYAKSIAMSIGCIIGLAYIISGAENLKF